LGLDTEKQQRLVLGCGLVRLPVPVLSGFRAQTSRAERSPVSWAIVVVLLALNVWYPCDHPLGIMFDVVLAVVLLIWYLSKSKAAYSFGVRYPKLLCGRSSLYSVLHAAIF
jgi:hypothetical protein